MNRFPLVVALMFCCARGQDARAEDSRNKKASPPPPAATAAVKAAKAPARGASRIAVVDPTTGQLVTPSAEQRAAFAQAAEASGDQNFSHEGLIEEALAEGGYMVHLQGRFRTALYATVGPDGKVRLSHSPAPTPAPTKAGAATDAIGKDQK